MNNKIGRKERLEGGQREKLDERVVKREEQGEPVGKWQEGQICRTSY
jgi:hypothetical protein